MARGAERRSPSAAVAGPSVANGQRLRERMGQSTLGILFGYKFPEEPEEVADATERLVDAWDKACKFDWRSPEPRVRFEYAESGQALVGIWIAVGASGKDGVPSLGDDALPLDQLTDAFGKRINEARALWKRFVEYAARDEIRLPLPRFWLVPTEVA